MPTFELEPVDRFEVLTLQDNAVDLIAGGDSEVVQRARGLGPQLAFERSLLAEHGFSALLGLTRQGRTRRALFDFGFSPDGAARNARALDADPALGEVEVLVLSHGHVDHFGGLTALVERVDRPGVELVAHPAAFRSGRHVCAGEATIELPPLYRVAVEALGVRVAPSAEPRLLLGGQLLFLGEIPRRTRFEAAPRHRYYRDACSGEVKPDALEDDSAVAAHLRGRGLIVLSGCAHSGIVNTVHRARQLTGVQQVHLVMGGFHLSGAASDSVEATIDALERLAPSCVVPTHCTGRAATARFEQRMPGQFLFNLVGTRLSYCSRESSRPAKIL